MEHGFEIPAQLGNWPPAMLHRHDDDALPLFERLADPGNSGLQITAGSWLVGKHSAHVCRTRVRRTIECGTIGESRSSESDDPIDVVQRQQAAVWIRSASRDHLWRSFPVFAEEVLDREGR